ncbi:hypothetical protein AURDEDRAFT_168043 [Auricularia subglabra TFB-10046 SS5]|nr:hypothetical protein AURDEDRAFT_168043 [Auricularia subglabra TFB-10046 SS5]
MESTLGSGLYVQRIGLQTYRARRRVQRPARTLKHRRRRALNGPRAADSVFNSPRVLEVPSNAVVQRRARWYTSNDALDGTRSTVRASNDALDGTRARRRARRYARPTTRSALSTSRSTLSRPRRASNDAVALSTVRASNGALDGARGLHALDAALEASWRETLTMLSLDAIPLSVGSCLALSGLSALRQLDLHPKLVDSSDLRTFAAQGKPEAVSQPRVMLLSPRTLGDEVHVVSLGDEAAGELLSMLRLFLPELDKLEAMHVGGYSELYPGGRHFEEILREDSFIFKPFDVWNGILTAEETRYARYRLANALAGTCQHARELALEFCAPAAVMRAEKMFMLHCNTLVTRNAPALSSPFATTRSVRVLSHYSHFRAMISAARDCFPSMSCLEVYLDREQRWSQGLLAWRAVSAGLRELGILNDVQRLRQLRVHLFIDHDFEHVVIDVSGLSCLARAVQLSELSIRIGGGLSLTSNGNLICLPAVHRLRLSVQMLALLKDGSWSGCCGGLGILEIEEERRAEHLWRRYLFDAAGELTGGLGRVVKWCKLALTDLRLVGVSLDLESIFLIGELSSMVRLDIHPSTMELLPTDNDWLKTNAARQENGLLGGRSNYVTTTGVGPITGATLVLDKHEITLMGHTLQYLLSHLKALRVLHFGGFGEACVARLCTAFEAQDAYTEIFDTIADYVWLYFHMPDCDLCASSNGRQRSPECLERENKRRVEWQTIIEELYLVTVEELPTFAHPLNDARPPGRVRFVALRSLAETCKAIRVVCLPHLYNYLHISRTQSIIGLDAVRGKGFIYREAIAASAREGRVLRAAPFLWTTSLVLHASPIWLLDEQFLAVSRSLPALKHLRLHVLFRKSEATQALAYRGALSQINTFLTSTAGQMLVSVGFWFSVPGQERPSSGALREMLLTSKPLLIGPKVEKLFFFPRLGALRNHNGADLGEDALRFLPWPCAVKEIAMSATDFCICDPINWHRHYELERVTLSCEDVLSEVHGDESLARRIAVSLGRAAPWWRDSLTLLRLENTSFDTSCALAVAEFRSLSQLDLHPSVVDASEAMRMLEVENENLMEAQARLEMDDQGHMLGTRTRTRRRMVIVPDHADLVGSDDFAQLEEDTAAAMLMLLKLCLPSLPLRVAHIGGTASCSLEKREALEDRQGFMWQVAIMCPSLRVIHIGPHGIHYGCHAHIADSCSCECRGKDLRPMMDAACSELLAEACSVTNSGI